MRSCAKSTATTALGWCPPSDANPQNPAFSADWSSAEKSALNEQPLALLSLAPIWQCSADTTRTCLIQEQETLGLASVFWKYEREQVAEAPMPLSVVRAQ